MAAEGGALDARKASEAFVEKYYHTVGTMTHAAHTFYADDCIVTRPGPDGTTMSFSSLEAIKKHYLSSYYDGTTFDVVNVDSQSSLGDGVFIMVIGFLTGKDNLKRKFSQAFYLARPNGVYAVVNDIHRFVDEESSTTRALPVVESVPEATKPVEEIKNTAQVHKSTKKKSVKAAEVKKVATPEKAVTAEKPKEPVAETSATPALDGAKKSYASMVLSMSRNAAPVQVKAAPVQKPSTVAQPKPHVAPAPEKKSEQKMVDEPGTSIFVSNLPMDARPPQVYELFKGFGAIKGNGVQIRSSRFSGSCFAFVSFESVASVKSVLKAAKNNQFKLGEHKLRVKEKQVEYNSSKPSGGRSEGGSMSQSGSVDGRKTPAGSVDGSKTENVSVGGEEDDGFKVVRSRRNRSRSIGKYPLGISFGSFIAVARSRSVNMYVGLLTLVSSGKYPMMLQILIKKTRILPEALARAKQAKLMVKPPNTLGETRENALLALFSIKAMKELVQFDLRHQVYSLVRPVQQVKLLPVHI
ncbi:BnaA07g24340D [Brassica napus]|nr:unnamed protein product [Brassica napus]CDY07355.1 BnaA07g24340D [Brassica napus]